MGQLRKQVTDMAEHTRRKCAIYREVDPRDRLTHYVGRSDDPYKRHQQHLHHHEKTQAMRQWIDDLATVGLEPQLEIIEWCDSDEAARKREVFWITDALEHGMPLANMTSKNSLLMTDIHASQLRVQREKKEQVDQAAYLFEVDPSRFGFTIVKKIPPSRYILREKETEKEHTAVILSTSFEYWQHRYHLAKHPPELVICYTHDTCCNVPVLSLHDGYLYAPCQFPSWFSTYADRVTRRGKQVFLGALLSGMSSAFAELDRLPRATQYRYHNDLKLLRRKKRGRPVEGKSR
jgi:hypothetical protein